MCTKIYVKSISQSMYSRFYFFAIEEEEEEGEEEEEEEEEKDIRSGELCINSRICDWNLFFISCLFNQVAWRMQQGVIPPASM